MRRLKFPLAPMGALAPGSAHARPFAQPPIDTSGNVLTQVSGGWAQKLKSIPLAPMGALAPGSAHARPFAQAPIDTSGNFPINFLTISGDSKH